MPDKALMRKLQAPFPEIDVKWLPKSLNQERTRAVALAYVTARAVQDRLDDVFGVEGWEDNYELIADGCIICRLKVKIGETWIEKSDVGNPSEQPDKGDRMKAAFSDALKRAAVKFGVGRYLYRLPAQWCDYDNNKKSFAKRPGLPAWALPSKEPVKAESAPAQPAQDQKAATNGHAEQPQNVIPADGPALLARLGAKDEEMAAAKQIGRGELLQYVRSEGLTVGFSDDIASWDRAQVEMAVAGAADFVQRRSRGLITWREEDDLRRELDRRIVVPESILEHFKISSLGQMPKKYYADLMVRLKGCALKTASAIVIP